MQGSTSNNQDEWTKISSLIGGKETYNWSERNNKHCNYWQDTNYTIYEEQFRLKIGRKFELSYFASLLMLTR